MNGNAPTKVVLRTNELEELHQVLNFYSQVYDGKLWNDDLDMLYERILNVIGDLE